MQHEARMPEPVAARKQVADMVQNPSGYFERAWVEARQLADQQIDREFSGRGGTEPWRIIEVDQKHESKPESKGLRYLLSKSAEKKAARERLRLREEKKKRAKLIGRNLAVEVNTPDGKKLIVKVVRGRFPADITKPVGFKLQDNPGYTIHLVPDSGKNRSGKHVAIADQSKDT